MQRTLIDKRYRVLKKLGSGAMGTVYKVRDLKDNAIIALKILSKMWYTKFKYKSWLLFFNQDIEQ
jgi:hypothetical protein